MLKGLALLRLGRPDDCVALIDEVHKQSPTDEQTLQAMTIYYKELDQRKSDITLSDTNFCNQNVLFIFYNSIINMTSGSVHVLSVDNGVENNDKNSIRHSA